MRFAPSMFFAAVLLVSSVQGQDCECEVQGRANLFGPPMAASASSQSQLYPYDQQDPWLHGQHQRVPSYGGYNSFRPHNYRHVIPQGQIATNWGATQGLSYSHQFFNRYRSNYLNGGLHSQNLQSAGPAIAETQQPDTEKVQQPFRAASVSRQPSPQPIIAGPPVQQQRR